MHNMPAWTYSQLDSFESCPKKYFHIRVAKDVVDPPNVHNEWGERVHTALENYIAKGDPLPEGMTQWEPLMQKFAALPGEKFPEQRFGLDRNFQPSDWKQSWTRGIADLAVVGKTKAAVIDYKTGKRKPTEQLDLYAAYAFAYYPQVQQVTTAFVWLKEKKIDKKVITRDEVPNIWQGLLPRVRKLESAYERESWPARPSGLCNGWCPVKQCKFYREKR